MEDQPSQFQRTLIKQYPARTESETAESRYWRRFRAPETLQQVCTVSPFNTNVLKTLHSVFVLADAG